jgi:hypothetical protein
MQGRPYWATTPRTAASTPGPGRVRWGMPRTRFPTNGCVRTVQTRHSHLAAGSGRSRPRDMAPGLPPRGVCTGPSAPRAPPTEVRANGNPKPFARLLNVH